jgi:hypothetical protein
MPQELTLAEGNCLTVLGELGDGDIFPYFLVTEESRKLLDQIRLYRDDLLESAREAPSESKQNFEEDAADQLSLFAEALFAPETYWK